MPVVKITTNFKFKEPSTFIDAFHQLMQQIFKIKTYDRLIILDEKPNQFYQPLDTQGNYVLVEIELFNGRTLDTKRKLYQSLVEMMLQFDVPKENVRIALIEIPKENWGVRGGQAACDVDLGYKIDI